jgi:hypothetical protein
MRPTMCEDREFRVIDAGYTSACACCNDGDQKLVAIPNANRWVCMSCITHMLEALEAAYQPVNRL